MSKIFRLCSALVVAIAITASPSAASANVGPRVVISEVQTGTTASASQEFIELYNPTDVDISVDGWSLEYKSATSSASEGNWTKRATLSGTIRVDGFYLAAPKAYLAAADADWTATLAGGGGNIRLKDGGGNVVDQLGYGDTANAAEGRAPAMAPPAGQSIERLPGRLDELGGNGTDTDNNASDFVLRVGPEPQNTQSLIEIAGAGGSDMTLAPPDITPPTSADASASPSDNGDNAPTTQSYAPLDITELLANPMTPLTDAHDEFIELYNPTDSAVDIAGYTLRTGSNFHAYYVIPSQEIPSGGYVALYSSQTKLSLVNSGGAAEILDPSGALVDVTPAYGAAPEGQSWARFDDGWHWTLQLTPNQPNVLATAMVLAANTTAKPKAVKRATTPKSTTVKKKAKAAPKPAKKRVKKPKAATTKLQPQLAAARSLQPATWLIIGLAALTIGYALYEFRYDIQNLYCRLRGYPAPGREDRPSTPGRDHD